MAVILLDSHKHARREALAALLATLLVLAGCATLSPRDAVTVTTASGVVQLTLPATPAASTPQAELDVEWRSPAGRLVRVPAFRDGKGRWNARLLPHEAGRWEFTAGDCVPPSACTRGSVHVSRLPRDETVRVDNTGTRARLAFADGRSFIGIGDTAYGIVTGVPERMLEQYIRTRAAQGFNFVRLFASGMPFRIHREVRPEEGWPWGGTPQAPDYDRFNARFFARLERVIARLQRAGMRTELLLYNYYSWPFSDPVAWTPARERAWLRELMARFASNPAILMWTITNEYEVYPDARYTYDPAIDDRWVRDIARQVHALDPQRHPFTAHNFSFDADGGVATRFRDVDVDVLTQQEWGRAAWNGRFLDGDAVGIDAAIRTDLRSGRPVVNTENGYEWLQGFADFHQQVSGTDKTRRAAWRAIVGGAAAYAAGFASTWHGNHEYEWQGTGPLRFEIRDMGWGRQVRQIGTFLRRVDLARFDPVTDLVAGDNPVLGRNGEEFVGYAPLGGALELDLRRVAGNLCLRWFDPRTGSMSACNALRGGERTRVTAPSDDDWVLWIRGL